MENKVKTLNNTQLLELVDELKKPTRVEFSQLPVDSPVRLFIGDVPFWVLELMRLERILLHEIAYRFKQTINL